jgi:hypothetical protein
VRAQPLSRLLRTVRCPGAAHLDLHAGDAVGGIWLLREIAAAGNFDRGGEYLAIDNSAPNLAGTYTGSTNSSRRHRTTRSSFPPRHRPARRRTRQTRWGARRVRSCLEPVRQCRSYRRLTRHTHLASHHDCEINGAPLLTRVVSLGEISSSRVASPIWRCRAISLLLPLRQGLCLVADILGGNTSVIGFFLRQNFLRQNSGAPWTAAIAPCVRRSRRNIPAHCTRAGCS